MKTQVKAVDLVSNKKTVYLNGRPTKMEKVEGRVKILMESNYKKGEWFPSLGEITQVTNDQLTMEIWILGVKETRSIRLSEFTFSPPEDDELPSFIDDLISQSKKQQSEPKR